MLDGSTCCYVVLRPLAWTGVGQLNERERGAADGGQRLQEETKRNNQSPVKIKLKSSEEEVSLSAQSVIYHLHLQKCFEYLCVYLLPLSGSEFAVVEEAVQKLP